MSATNAEAIAKRLTRLYSRISESEREAGRAWYYRATGAVDEIASDYDLPRATVAAVVALLSPAQSWSTNLRSTRALIDVWTHGDRNVPCVGVAGFHKSVRKALRYLDGDHSALRGPKVEAFAANLRGDLEYVTLDRWACRAAIGREAPGKARDAIVSGYIAAARRVGVSPAVFQAIIWVRVRGSAD